MYADYQFVTVLSTEAVERESEICWVSQKSTALFEASYLQNYSAQCKF